MEIDIYDTYGNRNRVDYQAIDMKREKKRKTLKDQISVFMKEKGHLENFG